VRPHAKHRLLKHNESRGRFLWKLLNYETRIDDVYERVSKSSVGEEMFLNDRGTYGRLCDVYFYMFCLPEEKMLFVDPY